MKFLSVPSLEKYSLELSHIDLGDIIIHGRIEAYSCKPTDEEKKLHKKLNSSLVQSPSITATHSHSPKINSTYSPNSNVILNSIEPLSTALHTNHAIHHSNSNSSITVNSMSNNTVSNDNSTQSLNNLNDTQTRKLLVQLITTMNNVFTDYDFSSHIDRISSKFIYEQSTQSAITTINNLFINSITDQFNPSFRTDIWRVIDECIELDKCDVYSYNDELNELNSGKLWFSNYFFYNKKLKKIVFLEAHAVNKLHRDSVLDNDSSVDSSMYSLMRHNDITDGVQFDDDSDSDDDSDNIVQPHIDPDDITTSDDEIVFNQSQRNNKSLSDYNNNKSMYHTSLSPHIQLFNVDDKSQSDIFQLDDSVTHTSNHSKSMLHTSNIPKPTQRRA